MEEVIKWAVAAAVLFPWSLVVCVIASGLASHRRRSAGKGYIPPDTRPPQILDSAQIVKMLRETRQ